MAEITGKPNTADIPPAAPITAPTVAVKTGKTKPKRLSKSERTHQRRLKQAAHKPAAGG